MRKRSHNKDTPSTTTTQLGPIYDDVKLPETSKQKEIIELQGNTAYGDKTDYNIFTIPDVSNRYKTK